MTFLYCGLWREGISIAVGTESFIDLYSDGDNCIRRNMTSLFGEYTFWYCVSGWIEDSGIVAFLDNGTVTIFFSGKDVK